MRAFSSYGQFDAKVPKIFVIFIILPSAVITWCYRLLQDIATPVLFFPEN
jgi:hypothetical protein